MFAVSRTTMMSHLSRCTVAQDMSTGPRRQCFPHWLRVTHFVLTIWRNNSDVGWSQPKQTHKANIPPNVDLGILPLGAPFELMQFSHFSPAVYKANTPSSVDLGIGILPLGVPWHCYNSLSTHQQCGRRQCSAGCAAEAGGQLPRVRRQGTPGPAPGLLQGTGPTGLCPVLHQCAL